VSDYKDGWQDGYNFAREEIIDKLKEIPIKDIDGWLLDKLVDMIETNSLWANGLAVIPVQHRLGIWFKE